MAEGQGRMPRVELSRHTLEIAEMDAENARLRAELEEVRAKYNELAVNGGIGPIRPEVYEKAQDFGTLMMQQRNAARAEAAQLREQLTRACAVLRMWMDTLTPPHGIPAAEFKAKYGVHTFADAMDAITDRAEAVLAEVGQGEGGQG